MTKRHPLIPQELKVYKVYGFVEDHRDEQFILASDLQAYLEKLPVVYGWHSEETGEVTYGTKPNKHRLDTHTALLWNPQPIKKDTAPTQEESVRVLEDHLARLQKQVDSLAKQVLLKVDMSDRTELAESLLRELAELTLKPSYERVNQLADKARALLEGK